MLTREVAEAHAAEFRRWLEVGGDPLLIKWRIWNPTGFDLVTFEAAEHDGAYYMQLRVRERETGRTGYVETAMGPVNDTSIAPEDEYVRAENIIEDMANLGPQFLVWDS